MNTMYHVKMFVILFLHIFTEIVSIFKNKIYLTENILITLVNKN